MREEDWGLPGIGRDLGSGGSPVTDIPKARESVCAATEFIIPVLSEEEKHALQMQQYLKNKLRQSL